MFIIYGWFFIAGNCQAENVKLWKNWQILKLCRCHLSLKVTKFLLSFRSKKRIRRRWNIEFPIYVKHNFSIIPMKWFQTMTLLRSFAKNSIEKNDRIFLMLVFLYTPERPDKNNNNDFFKPEIESFLSESNHIISISFISFIIDP